MNHKLQLTLLICITAAVLLAPAAAQAHAVVFVGPRPVIVARPLVGWGWYGPYWGPYPYGYYYAPETGAVKFDTDVKDADVFIDGAYAGTVGKLKTLHLRPGSFNIELRAPGRRQFAEKIYVVAGKTLHLHPDLRVQGQS